MRKPWLLVFLTLVIIVLPVSRLSSQNKSVRADDSRIKDLEDKVHYHDLQILGLEDKIETLKQSAADASDNSQNQKLQGEARLKDLKIDELQYEVGQD